MKLGHVIHIDAPPEVVWAVTEDIERWPEWTPTVESAKRLDQGRLDIGSTALLKQPGLPEATWVVTAFLRVKHPRRKQRGFHEELICLHGGVCPPNPLTGMPFIPTASSGALWHG